MSDATRWEVETVAVTTLRQRVILPGDRAREEEMLDAYSRAVTEVIDAVGPAVVSLQITGGRRREGQGSGIVVAPDGYVLTNSHVVHRAGDVRALMVDGKVLRGTVVGDDPSTDLALVRLDGSSLPFAAVDAGHRARKGQLAIAIGNPLGFDATVSTGVVSSLGRSLRGRDGRLIDDVIQHTAPLNPGNSGGALVSASGRVLGVNTAMISRSQGIGFAIAAETASWVLSQLLTRGSVRRAHLGITGHTRPLDRKLARHHGLAGASAVEILSVVRRGPAAAAGLRRGDVVVSFDGDEVETIAQLHRRVRDWPSGRALVLGVLRRGRRLELTVLPTDYQPR